MVKIELKNIKEEKNKIIVEWTSDKSNKFLKDENLEVAYDFEIQNRDFYLFNIFVSTIILCYAFEENEIELITPFKLSELIKDYWNDSLKNLNLQTKLIWTEKNDFLAKEPTFNSIGRLGLLFGGGVESTFALSQIFHHKPILLSIEGAEWMNNNTSSNGVDIKKDLELKISSNYDLKFAYISTNARSLILKDDIFVNHYITGYLFYHLTLPVTQYYEISTIIKSSEMEEALNFSNHDLSLNPRFTPKISPKLPNYPLNIPYFNAYSKVQMFEELSKNGFLEYIYSCYYNSGQRWCGKCSKCFRISEYCERLGIDKRRINMQEGIIGIAEKGNIGKNYWEIMDKLYGKTKYGRYSIMKLQVFFKKVKNKILK